MHIAMHGMILLLWSIPITGTCESPSKDQSVVAFEVEKLTVVSYMQKMVVSVSYSS